MSFDKTTMKWTHTLELSPFVLLKCSWWINTRVLKSELVDVWAAGCILYTLLSGYQPFYAKYVADLIELIKQGKYDFNSEVWCQTSESAKDLIKSLLQTDSSKRITVVNALKHHWFTTGDVCESNTRFSDQDFRNNLIRNQRRLTRNIHAEIGLLKIKSDTYSFNKDCRKSLILKEQKFD